MGLCFKLRALWTFRAPHIIKAYNLFVLPWMIRRALREEKKQITFQAPLKVR